MNPPIDVGAAFNEGARRGAANMLGRRQFRIDYSGAEQRFAEHMARKSPPSGGRPFQDYGPRGIGGTDLPTGWTVQTPWAAPPPVDTDYLTCVLCGTRDTPLRRHDCVMSQLVTG